MQYETRHREELTEVVLGGGGRLPEAVHTAVVALVRQELEKSAEVPHFSELRSNGAIAKYGQHPLFALGFKVGTSSNARLQWRESDGDEFLAQCRDDAITRSTRLQPRHVG